MGRRELSTRGEVEEAEDVVDVAAGVVSGGWALAVRLIFCRGFSFLIPHCERGVHVQQPRKGQCSQQRPSRARKHVKFFRHCR